MTVNLKNLSIKDIRPNPYQPRLNFKSEELNELAQSIKENGLIQPIIVRPSDVIGYELVAGERRLRASQLAGLTEIPAIIKQISDEDSRKQAILENLQRQNLNPIEEAKAYQQLILKENMTHEDIATSMGKSRPYITNSLRLLNLPENVTIALETGKLSPGHARLLLGLDKEEQERWLSRIIDNHLSVRQVENDLKRHKKAKRKKISNLFIREIENQISQELGLRTTITEKKQNKGQVIIHFDNLEDFHRIINSLGISVDKKE